ncbi:MAG: DUF2235 domain-containing protein [Pseudomonadota bacterium]
MQKVRSRVHPTTLSGATHAVKRLIVCCDGTWNTPDMASPTNVVRMAQAIRKSGAPGKTAQVVYYDEGVGTGGPIDKFVGGGVGKGIDINIMQAYRFLANNYEAGDEIYLFGFSRGAYTIRSLGGMIGIAGLLGRDQITDVSAAYELYRSKPTPAAAKQFRQNHRTETIPDITVMGCWDTVGALGLPDKLPWLNWETKTRRRYAFVDTRLGKHVKAGLHAVAIDERRKEFDYTPMQKAKGAGQQQIVKQAWFPGDHGSVGGGSEHKEPLSRAALQWMCDEIHSLGLKLSVDLMRVPGLQSEDENAFFSPTTSVIYGKNIRKLDAQTTFHKSALLRFTNLPGYRKSLGKSQREKLESAAKHTLPTLTVPTTMTSLAPGETAHVIVRAEQRRNRTNISLEADGRYEISVASTQHWQDGELPPCRANGWNVDDPALESVFDGMASIGTKPLIKMGRKSRVMPEEDWFVLCGEQKIPSGYTEPFAIGDGSRLPNGVFHALVEGELVLFANDLSSKIGLLDKYDNNAGWLVLRLKRLSQ